MTAVSLAAIAESTVNRFGRRGKHTSAYAELHAHTSHVEADNRQLTDTVEDRESEIHTALVRGCQDAVLIAQLKEHLAAAVAGIRKTQGDLIRSKAEQDRLRQAVINARPKIREVSTDLVRPYSPVVCLPYMSPVQWADTSNDETQPLAVIDWPTYPAI